MGKRGRPATQPERRETKKEVREIKKRSQEGQTAVGEFSDTITTKASSSREEVEHTIDAHVKRLHSENSKDFSKAQFETMEVDGKSLDKYLATCSRGATGG